ncbi:MAG: alpha/beta fold hydrolase [Gemmatimonadaceae bacterium]
MDGTAVLHELDVHPCKAQQTSRKTKRIVAADGYKLSADVFMPATPPRGIVVIAGGVAIPQRFYCRFAEQARQRGYQVITFDYRGIARSAPRTLRGFNMDIRDWGQLDLAAVIEAAADEADKREIPLYLVAHSFGGHAFGMCSNHRRVHACFTYGTGAGWGGWMPLAERLRVLALWNVVGPLLTSWSKYLSWSALGMGEDLPLNVFRQWRRWCRYPHYFFDDPVIGSKMRAMFSRVQTPMLAVAATDDRWSPPRSRDAFLTGYTNAHVTRLDLNPQTAQVGSLGHMGYFRSHAATLWPRVFEWFESV